MPVEFDCDLPGSTFRRSWKRTQNNHCKMEGIRAAGVTGFRRYRLFDLGQQDLLSRDQKIKDMYEIDSPIVDSDQDMQ